MFVAAGLITVLCSTVGILKSSYLVKVPSILYQMVIPLLLGYESGKKCGGDAGGSAGALAAAAVILSGTALTMVSGVLAGAFAGFLLRVGVNRWGKRIPAGFEMLAGNLYLVAVGLISGLLSCVAVLPMMVWVEKAAMTAADVLIKTGLLPWTGILIEPMKVLFFNNWLNHGILLPLGLEQVRMAGSSVLFLLEENPGPGFGILAAYMLSHRRRREEMTSSLIIQMIGGIHELYFPYILSDLRLLAAVIAGAVAGNYCFWLTGCGLQGPASPGSVITILMMAERGHWPGLIMGILISAVVSGAAALLILKKSGIEKRGEEEKQTEADPIQGKDTGIMKIYFVCDAGMGSSAMASALFKKRLKAENMEQIQVFHVSADHIPEDADLIVCQKNFVSCLPATGHRCYAVESLTDMGSYDKLLGQLKGGL